MMAELYTGKWPTKLSEEAIIYGIDWAKRLKSDYIVSANFTDSGDSGISLNNIGKQGRISKVTISGGTPESVAYITATIVTASGAILAERMRLPII